MNVFVFTRFVGRIGISDSSDSFNLQVHLTGPYKESCLFFFTKTATFI